METTSAFLKVISSLTSVKTSIKFVIMGVLWMSFPELTLLVEKIGLTFPLENSVSTAMVVFGLGSILGEIFYFVAKMMKKYSFDIVKEKIEDAHKEKIEKEKKEKFLSNFTEVFEHFESRAVSMLQQLSKGQQSFSHDPEGIAILNGLLDSGYIRKSIDINEYASVYKLHPYLKEFLEKHLQDELASNQKALDECSSSTKNMLFEMLKNPPSELSSEDYDSLKNYCKHHRDIFNCHTIHEDGDWEKSVICYRFYVLPRYRNFVKTRFSIANFDIKVQATQI
ncbi:hypothetical protein FWP48_22785 [Vibrio parahaemolyticus]|nr:hypothetical protein [Vibrio parahaemolyticus]EJB0392091.1 hypothetical protein [Vibrio parahaemolyticus]